MDLRLIVTLLDVGSAVGILDEVRMGVCGDGGSLLCPSSLSSGVADRCVIVLTPAASTDLLREPPPDIRCRFLEECSSLSKGFGRVEQGSEDTARSRDNSTDSRSIWRRDSTIHR